MVKGRSNHTVATRLRLTIKSVDGHVARIFSKLGLEPRERDHRRVLAVITWLRETADTASPYPLV